MPGDALDVRIAAKRFAARTILGPIGFRVEPGQIVALYGPSGAGKTTLLRIILGLDRLFDGRIERPSGRVGVAFQEPRLAPWLSVSDNLRLVAPALDDAAIEDALRAAALPGYGQARPRDLSLGMSRRVAVARALVARPSWLVLDEPFASLDPALVATLAGALASYARHHGTMLLFTTHALEDGLLMADRALVLEGSPTLLGGDIDLNVRSRTDSRQALLAAHPFLRGSANDGMPGRVTNLLNSPEGGDPPCELLRF